jgi:hypothetical protein
VIRPVFRAPLLVLGFVALATGVGAGLARLGAQVPDAMSGFAAWHGVLMAAGFFGVVISLERAVAINRAWAYLAPLATGIGTLALIVGSPSIAAALMLAGSGVMLAATLDVVRRQRALFTITLALATLAWVVANALWLYGQPMHVIAQWSLAFLVLTIAGERLELSRLLPPSAAARAAFAAIVTLLAFALVAAQWAWGPRVYGAALLALAIWLVKQDIARRTIRASGLTRFIAVCLLSGYVWLAIGGTLALVAGLSPGTPAYDAAIHAIALGFVFSMVFGHAPIIFPAVMRVKVPYSAAFYGPLLVLHASLVVRLAGDALASIALTRTGGWLNALALVAFIAGTAAAVLRGRARVA